MRKTFLIAEGASWRKSNYLSNWFHKTCVWTSMTKNRKGRYIKVYIQCKISFLCCHCINYSLLCRLLVLAITLQLWLLDSPVRILDLIVHNKWLWLLLDVWRYSWYTRIPSIIPISFRFTRKWHYLFITSMVNPRPAVVHQVKFAAFYTRVLYALCSHQLCLKMKRSKQRVWSYLLCCK